MPEGRVSKRSVDALSCPAGLDRVFLWDDDLAGFGIGAFPTGRKVYVAQYRQNGRSKRITLGTHGRLTPDEARIEAKKVLGSVAKGADPLADRKASKAIPTFREVADRYMAEHVRSKRTTSTADTYEGLLRNHVLPALGSVRVCDLKRVNVAKLHHDLATSPGAANRAVSVVSAIWNWAAGATEDPLYDRNPAQGIERYPEQGGERFLTTAELSRLGDALQRAETVGLPFKVDATNPKAKHAPKHQLRPVDPFALAAIRLLILTGARLREILHAEWRHVDFERGIIHLPDSKTGKKPVYLSAAAMVILADLPRIEGNPHLIAGAKAGKPRADLQRPWAAVIGTAGLPGLRLHDLRHSFASIGAGASLGLPIIGKLLGHSQPATTARYAHLDADPMRRAVDTIGATISAAMDGGRPKADVVNVVDVGKARAKRRLAQ